MQWSPQLLDSFFGDFSSLDEEMASVFGVEDVGTSFPASGTVFFRILFTKLRIFLSISASSSLGLFTELGFSEIFTPYGLFEVSFSGTGLGPGIICIGWILSGG